MNKYLSLLKLLSQPEKMKALLSFGHQGYLHEIGWFNSFEKKAPFDANGNPIPWVTYPFIDFIKDRIKNYHTVFEFGSGNSTFFYAKHAALVVSVEHDKEWFDKIIQNKPENSEMIFSELIYDGDYCRMPVKLEGEFDIIIIDGRDRVNCCRQAVGALSNDGVIILDDSEREFYIPAVLFLKEQGFKQLAFTGISPGLFYNKVTSVFYKTKNCLGV